MRLPRSYTMAHRSEFTSVRRKGEKSVGRFIVLSVLKESDLPHWKYAVITTRKSGKAHERNRIRRLVRETLVRNGERIKSSCYVVVIARWRAKEATFAEIESDWLRQARRLKLLAKLQS